MSESDGGVPADAPLDYLAINRSGWDLLSLLDDPEPPDPEDAKADLDPFGWIRWDNMRTVLCLAGGGGWIGPRFACLGYDVTVLDLSPGQLERDRQIGSEQGLDIACVEGDLMDPSPLEGARFDLVYQPVSACYVPDARAMYARVAGSLAEGGLYVVKHLSPIHLQVAAERRWDGAAYRLDRLADAGPTVWRSEPTWAGEPATVAHFMHPLDDLLGGLCDTGFDIVGFRQPATGDPTAPPDSDDHLAGYIPPFLWVAARLAR